jgi:hypothetical protein
MAAVRVASKLSASAAAHLQIMQHEADSRMRTYLWLIFDLGLLQIQKRANDGKLNIKFMGRVDHLDPQLRPYKVTALVPEFTASERERCFAHIAVCKTRGFPAGIPACVFSGIAGYLPDASRVRTNQATVSRA